MLFIPQRVFTLLRFIYIHIFLCYCMLIMSKRNFALLSLAFFYAIAHYLHHSAFFLFSIVVYAFFTLSSVNYVTRFFFFCAVPCYLPHSCFFMIPHSSRHSLFLHYCALVTTSRFFCLFCSTIGVTALVLLFHTLFPSPAVFCYTFSFYLFHSVFLRYCALFTSQHLFYAVCLFHSIFFKIIYVRLFFFHFHVLFTTPQAFFFVLEHFLRLFFTLPQVIYVSLFLKSIPFYLRHCIF